MTPTPITTLTPQSVQQQLQSDGIDTLGLTTLSLSPRWSDTTPSSGDYDATALTLDLSATHAPYRGMLDYAFVPVSSTLAAALSDTATTLTVATGDGNGFPSPSGGSILLTLTSASGTKTEIVECTARTDDSFTITRAAMNTTKQSFDAGDKVALRLSGGARADSYYEASGETLAAPCALFRLHPQAILRLQSLARDRYSTPANGAILPVPWTMVVRDVEGFTATRWYEADESMPGVSGRVSFHDGRGLIIDPVYVAALFADLQAWLPGLVVKNPSGTVTDAGGVQPIATLASGTVVHCLDLHGDVYASALPGATVIATDGGGAQTGTVGTNGLLALNAGDGIQATGDNGRLRWGWATNGVLARDRLVPPALPTTGTPAATLGRQFYRLAVVDTVWSLLGNRTDSDVLGIAGDDGTVPADILPAVRDQIVIDYLVDGPDTLARSAAVLARPGQDMVLAVSPVLDGTMSVPGQAGDNAHWPAFPPPNTGTPFPTPPGSPSTGISAAWTSGHDVVVTIAADAVPDGAHVRIYPQQFVTIPAITEEPSFLRGDGGAAIARAGNATEVLLINPFQLADGQPEPSPANLTMDIVVAPRSGTRKLWGAVSVSVTAGPATVPASSFSGGNIIGSMPATFESVAPVPLFGIPATVTPPGTTPSSSVSLVRALASEASPRQGPRLPTMARFETVIVTGTTGGTPAGTLLWEAVLTGGRWAPETRSALHASGNPGNPAGPDIHAPGIHVTGALAYDLARHAMRRAQPIIPLGAETLGWAVGMDGDNFNPPQDTAPTNTGIGVLLETVSAICETPELSALPTPPPGSTAQQLINGVASALGVTPPTLTLGNEPRMEAELRRESVVSKNGLRDSLWSLRRVVRDAREIIYVESPQFARTARPGDSPTPEQVDLVDEIVTSLQDHPNLKVIICTPRLADFAPGYKGWSREHYGARTEAVGDLLAVAPDRVILFHPVGFPGRTAYVRTTSVIVDDVWSLVGATHWRRRGMTFDGSAAIASFDRQMDNGYSRCVRTYRRALMAVKMAIPAPGAGTPSGDWLRLGTPNSAFELVRDWLSQGGLGKIQPLWPGPSDTTVLPATHDMADPDGSNGATFVTAFASLIAELGD